MNGELQLEPRGTKPRAISALLELGAYEALWEDKNASFKRLSELFARHPGSVPSDFVEPERAQACAAMVRERFEAATGTRFGVRVFGAGEYPAKLRDAVHPIQLLYFQGWWDLVESPSVAVVGTRSPSDEGLRRTRTMVRKLVADGFTIVSGLAAGVDTCAHVSAMDAGGHTIAVIGTPLSEVYPKENAELQRKIAEKFLVISQVPLCRYKNQDYRMNRFFFPERNITMSALTKATIIIEAGETSGTLIQARAALQQGRKLFILDSAFQDKRLDWPRRFEDQGAIRVRDYEDVRSNLAAASEPDR